MYMYIQSVEKHTKRNYQFDVQCRDDEIFLRLISSDFLIKQTFFLWLSSCPLTPTCQFALISLLFQYILCIQSSLSHRNQWYVNRIIIHCGFIKEFPFFTRQITLCTKNQDVRFSSVSGEVFWWTWMLSWGLWSFHIQGCMCCSAFCFGPGE